MNARQYAEAARDAVLGNIISERIRQDRKFGAERDHRDVPASRGTVVDYTTDCGVIRAAAAKAECELAAEQRRVTWTHILVEEVAEVIEAARAETVDGDPDLASLREELIQVAAVAVAWVEAIDRRLHAIEDLATMDREDEKRRRLEEACAMQELAGNPLTDGEKLWLAHMFDGGFTDEAALDAIRTSVAAPKPPPPIVDDLAPLPDERNPYAVALEFLLAERKQLTSFAGEPLAEAATVVTLASPEAIVAALTIKHSALENAARASGWASYAKAFDNHRTHNRAGVAPLYDRAIAELTQTIEQGKPK
jgi:NTP pyrophosphatase (non-canonical NTP hydrolase)